MEDTQTIWRTLKQFGGHSHNMEGHFNDMEDTLTLWRTIKQYGGHSNNMEDTQAIWRTLKQYGGHSSNMEDTQTMWRTLKQYWGHFLLIRFCFSKFQNSSLNVFILRFFQKQTFYVLNKQKPNKKLSFWLFYKSFTWTLSSSSLILSISLAYLSRSAYDLKIVNFRWED